ncbi:MAG: ABC transporter ATP-binding protein [Gammaproteobacteria bacterium]|nr:ABC transporter ATP-binding protein [Gammaproteobacteria bacterium]
MSATAAIEINALEKTYASGLKALDRVSFTVEQGEFFALLGPNGAGKSTLINTLAGLVRPSAGDAKVYGHSVQRDWRAARRALGVVPQELVFDPFFTVREVLALQAGYFGLKASRAWQDEVLEELGLSDKSETRMRGLSGGMKRRVLIAQALMHKPPVVVLDEPTAGVDVELRQLLWRFAKRLHNDGHTIVLTTHYLEEAESLCDRVAILDKGQLKTLQTTESLLNSHPWRDIEMQLLSFPSQLPASLQKLYVEQAGEWHRWRLHRDEHSVADLLEALKQQGAELKDIRTREPNLEDVFLQLVGRDDS